jgi:hypothetical protein
MNGSGLFTVAEIVAPAALGTDTGVAVDEALPERSLAEADALSVPALKMKPANVDVEKRSMARRD